MTAGLLDAILVGLVLLAALAFALRPVLGSRKKETDSPCGGCFCSGKKRNFR